MEESKTVLLGSHVCPSVRDTVPATKLSAAMNCCIDGCQESLEVPAVRFSDSPAFPLKSAPLYRH